MRPTNKPNLILIASFGCLLASAQAADPPNLVYFLADDMGYGDVSALNPEGKIPTPHIDRLAAEGMTFTDAHSTSSVCTPTRYNVLTGRYHWRTTLKRGVLNGYRPPLIAGDRLTFASLLRDHGYETAMIGKWHWGWNCPLSAIRPLSTIRSVDHSPSAPRRGNSLFAPDRGGWTEPRDNEAVKMGLPKYQLYHMAEEPTKSTTSANRTPRKWNS